MPPTSPPDQNAACFSFHIQELRKDSHSHICILSANVPSLLQDFSFPAKSHSLPAGFTSLLDTLKLRSYDSLHQIANTIARKALPTGLSYKLGVSAGPPRAHLSPCLAHRTTEAGTGTWGQGGTSIFGQEPFLPTKPLAEAQDLE